MTIQWTEKEAEAIRKMAKEKDMPEEAVIRQAIRLYQLHDHNLQKGYRPAWLNKQGEVVPEEIGGCMGD
jgi:hypothetical protein